MRRWQPRHVGAIATDTPGESWARPRASGRAGGSGVMLGVATSMYRRAREESVASCRRWPAPKPWTASRSGRWSGRRDDDSVGEQRRSTRMTSGAHLTDCPTDIKWSYILSLPIPHTKRKTWTSPSPQPNAEMEPSHPKNWAGSILSLLSQNQTHPKYSGISGLDTKLLAIYSLI